MELEDHVPVYIPEPEHPEDLVPAEDEAPTPPLPPFFLAPRIRPPHTRAAMRQMRATAPSHYHSLLQSRNPTIEGLLLTTPSPECERFGNRRVTYQVDVCTRESSEFCTRHHDAQKDRAAVRAEIEVLKERRELAYEQEKVHRYEWQRQAADDLAVQHIMRTQALEAGARVNTLEDTGSSS
ncbi:hypothetical protein Tco_0331875 [Tanacetum coccineum]